MIRHVVCTMAYALLVAGVAAPLAAQGTIRGSISDSSGSPLANASISVDGAWQIAATGFPVAKKPSTNSTALVIILN